MSIANIPNPSTHAAPVAMQNFVIGESRGYVKS